MRKNERDAKIRGCRNRRETGRRGQSRDVRKERIKQGNKEGRKEGRKEVRKEER